MLSKSFRPIYLTKLSIVLFSALFVFASPAFAHNENETSITTAEAALETLLRGNERFVKGRMSPKDILSERSKLVAGQKPYAIILACADSRVPPELVFDESLGRIFVIRVAGNVVDPAILGSIEYAVEHLHVPLLFVLGHENCGAVKAKLSGGKFPPNIAALLARISPAVTKVRTLDLDEKDTLIMAVKENVSYQMQMAVYESEVLRDAVREKHLKVVGGVYHLDTGKVDVVSNEVALQTFGEKESQTAAEKSEVKEDKPKTEKTDSRAKEDKKKPEPTKTEPMKTEKKEKEKPAKTAAPTINTSEGDRIAEIKQNETNKVGYQTVAVITQARPKTFQEALRFAYENKSDVMTKSSLLMRDGQDRCMTFDCRYLTAGESVKIASPFVLNVNGRPLIKVRYKGQLFYVLVQTKDFEFSTN